MALQFNQAGYKVLSSKEWLVTNGLGGYAAGVLSGANTRRYHGLLVASYSPPIDRRVVMAKMEESISDQRDSAIDLSSNQYPDGVIHPRGFLHLWKFCRFPIPSFHYKVGNYCLSKEILMVKGANTTLVRYKNDGNHPIPLRLTPLWTHRDYHHLNPTLQGEECALDVFQDGWRITCNNRMDPVYFKCTNAQFQTQTNTFYNLEYAKEAYRGLDFHENLASVGHFDAYLEAGQEIHFMVSTDNRWMEADLCGLFDQQKQYYSRKPTLSSDAFINDLIGASEQFIVERENTHHKTLIAGYPWFTDWGRDTMIALRGICIRTGKQQLTKSILRTFLQYLDEGMLPNRFPDSGAVPEYNTIDATLWLFVVIYEYYETFNDLSFIKEVFPSLVSILDWHFKGTRYGIQCTDQGVIIGGTPDSQLTWMDARVNGHAVTPRNGAAVEINALWYNALETFEFLLGELNIQDPFPTPVAQIIQWFKTHFSYFFWNEAGYLNDVVRPDGSKDNSIRPNQIFAVSLPFSILNQQQAESVLVTVEKHLLTPFGLRTLSARDPQFKPLYGGNPQERDRAYHQGTVWVFLIGEYLEALIKVYGWNQTTHKKVKEIYDALRHHFYERDTIGGISEIFDGIGPSVGRGTMHQAWSVSTLLAFFLKFPDWKNHIYN